MIEQKCPICGTGFLTKKIEKELFEYNGKYLTIPVYVVYVCDKCGEAIVDQDTMRTSGIILKRFFSSEIRPKPYPPVVVLGR